MIWNAIFMTRTKCQNFLRWFGQNANQKVGADKMPTTEKSQDKMPTFGWHYVRLAFCPVGILSYHPSQSTLLKHLTKMQIQILILEHQNTNAQIQALTGYKKGRNRQTGADHSNSRNKFHLYM